MEVLFSNGFFRMLSLGAEKLRWAVRARGTVRCSRCKLARLLQLWCLCLQTQCGDLQQDHRVCRRARQLRWWWSGSVESILCRLGDRRHQEAFAIRLQCDSLCFLLLLARIQTVSAAQHCQRVLTVSNILSFPSLRFRDKIKILHFAGKLKPWLIQFNSETKSASTPTDYAHAHDLIQHWWTIFCDSVHQGLSDVMVSAFSPPFQSSQLQFQVFSSLESFRYRFWFVQN